MKLDETEMAVLGVLETYREMGVLGKEPRFIQARLFREEETIRVKKGTIVIFIETLEEGGE